MTSDSFEAKMALSSITQNAGFSGLREISANTNPGNNEALVKIDDTRTRRSPNNNNATQPSWSWGLSELGKTRTNIGA